MASVTASTSEKPSAHALPAASLLPLAAQENLRPELAPAHLVSAAAVVWRPASSTPQCPGLALSGRGGGAAGSEPIRVEGGGPGVHRPRPSWRPSPAFLVPSRLAPMANSRAAERGPLAGRQGE